MKTIIEGVEITPTIANTLKKWLKEEQGMSELDQMSKWCEEIQDVFCRSFTGLEDVSEERLKGCLSKILYIKDELRDLNPKFAQTE
jgi:hypothetical protein